MGIYTGLDYRLVKGLKEEPHWHPELELLFVVEGESTVTIKGNSYAMKREDLALINSSVNHAVSSQAETVLCVVRFPWKLLNDLIGEGSKFFQCNSVTDADSSFQELRSCCRSLVYEYVNPSHKTKCTQDILMLQMLNLIIEHHQVELASPAAGRMSDDVRIQQILQYVNDNFQHNLSLSSLAEEMFISPSTLSRSFKRETGIYFVDYVNQVRARFGLTELLYSDASITEIAVNSGFSNLSVFSRVFKEIYGMTPTDYRRLQRKERGEENSEQLRHELAQRLPVNRQQPEESQHNVISFSLEQGEGYEKNWNKAINVGFVEQLTKSNLRSQTLYLVKNLGFTHARLWNVFARRLMLTDGVQTSGFNFARLDEALDFLVNNGIHPYLDLGRRPSTALLGAGKTVFFDNENEYVPFRSWEAWQAMVRQLLSHVVNRYGKAEVGQWILELGCDRSHPEMTVLYQDPKRPYDFADAFCELYRTVKDLVPQTQVGGPGLIPSYDAEFYRDILRRCVERGCKPDFISFMMFPYAEEVEEGGERMVSKRLGIPDAEAEQVRWMQELMRETGTEDCKLYACEWNNSLSNRNYLNDSCFRSAYLVRTINSIWTSLDMVCLRMASDLVSSYYDSYHLANGNGGLLTTGGIRKPAFFALQFLSALGAYVVERGEGYLVTRTRHGRLFILCYNYKWYSSNYFLREEYTTPPEELHTLFSDERDLELELVVQGVRDNTTYFINRQLISADEGDLLHEWARLSYEDTPECRDYLKEACFPRLSLVKQEGRNNRLVIREHLRAHEVSLFYIYPDD